MADELSGDEHVAIARTLYARWETGEAKSSIELEAWGDATSHGKRFTSYVRRWLDLETEKKSAQTEHVERLEALLRIHGVSPTEAGDLDEHFRLLAKARESGLQAVRIYNDPLSGFRTEAFVLLMVAAWNALMQAILERVNVDVYERDGDGKQILADGRPKVLGTRELAGLAFANRNALQANLDFFVRLRHLIAHRYLPTLDNQIVSEAQALLLNFENALIENFGEEAALGGALTVPLQLSGFRSDGALASLRRAQSKLPTDVQEFLARHREELPDEVLRSSEYALQVFFVPVAANKERAADALVYFFRPGEISAEQEEGFQRRLAVVPKPRRVAVASADLLRPTEVVRLVHEFLPFRFTSDTHTRCWRYFVVRPASGSSEPEATDARFCVWDRLLNGYGYTRTWVDKLISELSDAETYERVVGYKPEAR